MVALVMQKNKLIVIGSGFSEISAATTLVHKAMENGISLNPLWHAFQRIEKDIQEDFSVACQGILKLPAGAKLGVYLTYAYYINLFQKIKGCSLARIVHERISLPNKRKLALFIQTYFRYRFNYL